MGCNCKTKNNISKIYKVYGIPKESEREKRGIDIIQNTILGIIVLILSPIVLPIMFFTILFKKNGTRIKKR